MATIYVDENKQQHPLGNVIDSLPIGSIVLWPSSTIPSGYKICNGDTLLKTDYPDLFSVLNYTYGGSGNSFNLPDYRGRTPVGVTDGTGTVTATFTLANTGGEVTHTLTTQEMPSHAHTIPIGSFVNSDEQTDTQKNGHISRTIPQGINYSSNNTGGGQAHNNMQPYIVQNYIIKVSYSVAATGGGGGGDASSNIIIIGHDSDVTEDTKLLVEPEDIDNNGSEVVNSLSNSYTTLAPSVFAVNQALDDMKNVYSSTRGVKVGYLEDGTKVYRKVLTGTKVSSSNLTLSINDDVKEILAIPEAKIMTTAAGGYIIPFYESAEVFTRLEFNNNSGSVTVKSGTSSTYGQGTVRLAVLYTRNEPPFEIGTNYDSATLNMSFPTNSTMTNAMYSLGGGEQGENAIVTFSSGAGIVVSVDAAAGTVYYDLRFYPDLEDYISYTRLYAASYINSTDEWNYTVNMSTFTLPADIGTCSTINNTSAANTIFGYMNIVQS